MVLSVLHPYVTTLINKSTRLCSWSFDLLKAIIAPPMCASCKIFLRNRTVFCVPCSALIRPIVSCTMIVTATHSVPVFAISAYKDPIKSLILAKGAQNVVAARQMGLLLWQMTDLKTQNFDYIVPVPLHWWRYAQRSYNQAAEIAYGISTQAHIPVLHALKRTRATVRQSELSYDARAENVQHAFAVNPKMYAKLRGARILLVDDLMTTGATLKVCARQLLRHKPASIVVGVASRVT
jgi:ComF family protein